MHNCTKFKHLKIHAFTAYSDGGFTFIWECRSALCFDQNQEMDVVFIFLAHETEKEVLPKEDSGARWHCGTIWWKPHYWLSAPEPFTQILPLRIICQCSPRSLTCFDSGDRVLICLPSWAREPIASAEWGSLKESDNQRGKNKHKFLRAKKIEMNLAGALNAIVSL